MERFIVVTRFSVSSTIPFSCLIVQDITYQLISAGSSLQTLEVAATFKPDLFLIEHDPPSLDGVTLSHQLHELPDQENVPVLVVLPGTSSPAEYSSTNASYISYVNGPFELARLLEMAESTEIMSAC